MIYFAGMNYLCGISISSSRAPGMLKMIKRRTEGNYGTYVRPWRASRVRTGWSRPLPIIGERAAKALSKRPSITRRLSRLDEQFYRRP
jgi:hypothetical protein